MSMNFYNPSTIKAGVKISQYLKDQGIPVQGNRAVATWRDGKRESVSIDDVKGLFHDFMAEEGGDVIALCMKIEGLDFLATCRTLGDRYHLAPDKVSRKPPKASRADALNHDGYALVKTYTYTDEAGTPRYYVERWERTNADATHDKEFVQYHIENGQRIENISGVTRLLYNLPNVAKAEGDVYLVEGEKDADTLNALELVATTNSGGAGFWTTELAALLKDKNVVIIADNDDKGKDGANKRAVSLAHVAASVKVVTISALPKGDVTDWLDGEGGTVEKLRKIVANAAPFDAPPTNFSNFTEKEIEVFDERNGKPRTKTQREPKLIEEIIRDLDQRFDDGKGAWPRLLGGELFYIRKDNGERPEVQGLRNDPDQMSAWIGRTGHCIVAFATGMGMTSMKALVAGLLQTRHPYAAASRSRHYPERTDVYYMCEPPPPPSPNYQAFNALIDRFCPADNANRTILKMCFAAPMWYVEGSPRPFLLIDTIDAQKSGKSTIIKMIECLYEEKAFDFDLGAKGDGIKEIKNQLLGANGLSRRLVKFDNVTCTISDSTLAKTVTADTISGRPPYAKGTVDRRNDLTFYVTMNGASTDRDMTRRSYRLLIRAPEPDTNRDEWEIKTRSLIETTRPQIQGDIIGMMKNAKQRSRANGGSGFPEFDRAVLSAVCESDEEFFAADNALAQAASDADADAARAEVFEMLFNDSVLSLTDYRADVRNVYLTRAAAEYLLIPPDGSRPKMTVHDVRQFIRADLIHGFAKDEPSRNIPNCRGRGAFWYGEIHPDKIVEFQLVDVSKTGDRLEITFPNVRIHCPKR